MFPIGVDAWRVSDAAFARAYAVTGDRGRALIKSCIAGLYQAWRPGSAASTSTTERFLDGQVRIEGLTPRPWFALAIGPDVASPSQLVAAIMPALVSRIPQVLVFRPKARTGWPPALLTALELCGVEQVFSPSMGNFKHCLKTLGEPGSPCCPGGGGGVACLASRTLWERVREMVPDNCAAHWLAPPKSAALYAGPGAEWDREALAFAQAGLRLVEYGSSSLSQGSAGRMPLGDMPPDACASGLASPDGPGTDRRPWVAYAPAAMAPTDASLILAPGREALWDWPDMPRELFFARSLVYS